MNTIELIKDIVLFGGTLPNERKQEVIDFISKQEEAINYSQCCAELPSIEKLWSMADTIVDKQKKVLDIPNKEAIDWDDLKEDWFDWLGDEIVGN